MNDSEKVAAIRELFSRFNWETDDRQYALERIEQIIDGDPDPRETYEDYSPIEPEPPAGALSYIVNGDFPQ